MEELGVEFVCARRAINTYLALQPEIVVVFLAIGLMIALSNSLSVRRFDEFASTATFPRVSILVPVRNEAQNVEPCVLSLMQQNYPDFEVLVLDDQSTDETSQILAKLSQEAVRNPSSPHLRVLYGTPPPGGWLGKHWACHQLAQAATGELLLLTDADTRHAPHTLRDSVSALLAQDADLVTAFPRQETPTLGEKLTVPVIGFGIISFLPVALARWLRLPGLSVSIGQFMLFRRTALEAIGGYESVRSHLVDDVMLGRRILQHGMSWRLMDATGHVSCRMYHDFWQAVDGFTKNVFAFFEYRITLFVVAWLWMVVAFLVPPFVVLASALNMPIEAYPYPLALIASAEAVLLWSLAYHRFRFPIYLALLYPLSFAVFLLIASRSLVFTLLGQSSWKDRALVRPAWRW